MNRYEADQMLLPRPTAPEMRDYILQILDQLYDLSLDYELKDLALVLAVARRPDLRQGR